MSERWILKECPKCGFGRYIDDEWERYTAQGKEIVSMHLLRAPRGNIFAEHCEECGEWLKSWDKERESKMSMLLKFHEGVLVNGRRIVTCDIDGERFADFGAFRKHAECVHPEEIDRTEKAKREWLSNKEGE